MIRLTSIVFPLLAAAALGSPTAPAVPTGADSDFVHWRHYNFQPGEWPEGLPGEARTRIEQWAGWAEENGFRMDVDPTGRVLMLCEAKRNRTVRRELDLIEKTLDAFDGLVGKELPMPTADWNEPADEVAVIVRVRDMDSMQSFVGHVASRHPYLQTWAKGNPDTMGARFWEPSVAAWIEVGLDRDEWRAENELVHQTATMLTRERFGTLPSWLEAGLAWNVELEVCRSIYSFPGRSGFVSIQEHKGWASSLKRTFQRNDEMTLVAENFDAWTPGVYDAHQAGIAWGMVAFLQEYRPDCIGSILTELGECYESGSVVTRDDGSWERIPEFCVSAEVQSEIFKCWAGEDVYEECTEYLRQGSRYRPKAR